VGNALGAWVGGVTITAGLGYTSPLWAGALLTLAGLVVLVGADRADRRTRRRTPGQVVSGNELPGNELPEPAHA